MPVACKTYLIRAVHQWCVDHGYTPYLRVFVDEQVLVPPGYAQQGEITLNLSFDATSQLRLGDEAIEFRARFNGAVRDVYVPVSHVLAIFARENMEGLAFGFEPSRPDEAVALADVSTDASTQPSETIQGASAELRSGRPKLERVQVSAPDVDDSSVGDADTFAASELQNASTSAAQSAPTANATTPTPEPPANPPRPVSRPKLTLVK